jgi:hypothetical protein
VGATVERLFNAPTEGIRIEINGATQKPSTIQILLFSPVLHIAR